MAKHQPTLLVVNADKGIYINLNNTVSYAVERKSRQQRLKEGADPNRATQADFEIFTTDVVSFYFVAGTGLSYRVGIEITQDDFDRLAYILEKALPYTASPQNE